MTAPTHIAGDWGTSRLRLTLCAGGRALDRLVGPGAVGAREPHEAILFSLIGGWLAEHGRLPVVLCGMVGSRNGWVEAPYAPCPADLDGLRRRLARFTVQGVEIAILPGVSGLSPRGAPDVMRGEETQIAGALALEPALGRGRRLLALPGTHTKWVLVEDGRIQALQTALTGETFALLRDHGTLARVVGGAQTPGDGFALGLARQAETESAGLIHALFETRGRQLIDGWSPAFALDMLSGLLIGADVAGALVLFETGGEAVTLIGEPVLCDRYAAAFARRGAASRVLSGEACALSGLAAALDIRVGDDDVAH